MKTAAAKVAAKKTAGKKDATAAAPVVAQAEALPASGLRHRMKGGPGAKAVLRGKLLLSPRVGRAPRKSRGL